MIRKTLDCVRPTQSNVVQIIHHNVGPKCILFHLPKCLFIIIVIYLYFTYILQGSVGMHLQCGRIYNNHIIANCPVSTECDSKKFWKLVNNWRRLYKSKVARFLPAHPVLKYITNTKVNSAFHPSGVNKSSTGTARWHSIALGWVYLWS